MALPFNRVIYHILPHFIYVSVQTTRIESNRRELARVRINDMTETFTWEWMLLLYTTSSRQHGVAPTDQGVGAATAALFWQYGHPRMAMYII